MMGPRIFNKKYTTDEDAARGAVLKSYQNSAKKRNLVFELTDGQFLELTKQDCWYCGTGPAQIRYAENSKKKQKVSDRYCFYNGVDRLDNIIGYTINNSVPCCGKCNKMKMVLPVEDFLRQVKYIAHFHGLI
jgi:hypothetical protein